MNNEPTFNIFVSYSTANLKHVEKLQASLRDTPIRVFIAEHSIAPGESLPQRIEDGIAQCDLFIVLWSREADASRWVKAEVGHAKGQGKPIIPIVFDADVPLPPFIEDLKYIDASVDMEIVFKQTRQVILDHLAKKYPVVEARYSAASADAPNGLAALLLVGLGAFLMWAFSRE